MKKTKKQTSLRSGVSPEMKVRCGRTLEMSDKRHPADRPREMREIARIVGEPIDIGPMSK